MHAMPKFNVGALCSSVELKLQVVAGYNLVEDLGASCKC